MSKNCETNCRDDLISKISVKVDKGGVWKFVGVLITAMAILWGASYTIYANSVDKREAAIGTNAKKAADNSEKIAGIVSDLRNLKEGQQSILHELRRNRK